MLRASPSLHCEGKIRFEMKCLIVRGYCENLGINSLPRNFLTKMFRRVSSIMYQKIQTQFLGLTPQLKLKYGYPRGLLFT